MLLRFGRLLLIAILKKYSLPKKLLKMIYNLDSISSFELVFVNVRNNILRLSINVKTKY